MEHQNVLNSLNEAKDFQIAKRKWGTVNDQLNANYNAGNEIIYNAEVLKSNFCDCNDGYILVKCKIYIAVDNGTQVALKDYAPFKVSQKLTKQKQMLLKTWS